MEFDTKIKIVLREDLEPWQALNVTAFLMSGIAGTQGITGEPYEDKSGSKYLPMSQQPIMIHSASGAQLKELLPKALAKEMAITIFTEDLINTFNDEDNRAAVARFLPAALNLVRIGLRGRKNQIARLIKGFAQHK